MVNMSAHDQFRRVLTAVPKTEIHLHIEGLASVETIWELMNKHHILLDQIPSREALKKRFEVESLDEFIDLFINVIQNCFREEDDFEYLVRDARDYLTRNGIVYAEIFFAPSKFLLNGLSYKTIIEKLDDGAQALKRDENLDMRYLIDVSRTYGIENAQNNLEHVLANPKETVIGIGLGGAESQGPARDFERVFKRAADQGLRVVAHAGEDVGPESIWDAIRVLGAARIGHGISAIQDEKLMDYLASKKIPLEICPTSNVFTRKYVKRIEEHPIRAFYDHGLFVTVNTDDPTIFGIDLVDEYMNLVAKGVFSREEILALIKNNVRATFLDAGRKDTLVELIDRTVSKAAVKPTKQ